MPSTTKAGTKPAPKPQTRKPNAAVTPKPEQEAAPVVTEPVPTPIPAASPESLFDETPPAPLVAEQPPVDPAASGEASDDGRPEGAVVEQEATPPADPALGNIPDTPAVDAAPVVETPAEEPLAPEPVTDQELAPDAAKTEDAEQSFAEPEQVRLGGVTGFLHRMPLGDVLAYTEDFVAKIEALTHSAAVQALLPRMRATEGRCAPIYFTGDDDGEPEFLLEGDKAISAAIALGLETVSVVVIRPSDAGAAQSYLASEANKPASSSEDDFLLQVNAYHADEKPASPA